MLTDKQEKFCLNIVNGMKQVDAYKDAYDAENMLDNSIYREASLLIDNPKVAQRITELRDKAASSKIMSAIQRKEWLTNVINGTDTTSDKMKAMDILNKMDGQYTTKVEANVQMSYEDKLKEMIDEDED